MHQSWASLVCLVVPPVNCGRDPLTQRPLDHEVLREFRLLQEESEVRVLPHGGVPRQALQIAV